MRKFSIFIISGLLALGSLVSPADARPMVDAATQTEINQLYDALLVNPTDRALNLRYSTTLAKAGDFEAAIAPLERILVTEPHNAWLMVQLGILYNSLNSKIMARMYFEQAIAAPGVSEEIAQKAKTFLATL